MDVGCSLKGTQGLGLEEGGREIGERLGGREEREGATQGLGAGDMDRRGEEGSRIGWGGERPAALPPTNSNSEDSLDPPPPPV